MNDNKIDWRKYEKDMTHAIPWGKRGNTHTKSMAENKIIKTKPNLEAHNAYTITDRRL